MLQHLISTDDVTRPDIEHILLRAKQFKDGPAEPVLHGHILATAFFEPSTRTRLSFESAMHRLGGSVISCADATQTSMKKGETLEDTIRVMCGYADAIAIRHPDIGSAARAAAIASVPIINAGDGAGEHPTQALSDLFTIAECQGRLTDLSIGFVGDLKFGRTIHSLIKVLNHFPGNTIHLIAPPSLQLPQQYQHMLEQHSIAYTTRQTMEEILPSLDILYMTRVQQERFENSATYEHIKDTYILRQHMLSQAKPTLRILHPLPRVNEIHTDVDADEHAYYFEQARNTLFVRQAILTDLL